MDINTAQVIFNIPLSTSTSNEIAHHFALKNTIPNGFVLCLKRYSSTKSPPKYINMHNFSRFKTEAETAEWLFFGNNDHFELAEKTDFHYGNDDKIWFPLQTLIDLVQNKFVRDWRNKLSGIRLYICSKIGNLNM